MIAQQVMLYFDMIIIACPQMYSSKEQVYRISIMAKNCMYYRFYFAQIRIVHNDSFYILIVVKITVL